MSGRAFIGWTVAAILATGIAFGTVVDQMRPLAVVLAIVSAFGAVQSLSGGRR